MENELHDFCEFHNRLELINNIPHTTLFQGTFDDDMDYSFILNKIKEYYVRGCQDHCLHFNKVVYVPQGLNIKQDKNYQVLSIIGGIFVVLQAFINVAAMYGSVINGEWGYFVFATAGCVLLAIIGVIIWLMTLIKRKR